MRTIKKYPNRRLYDTTDGIYISLEKIKQFVYAHEKFMVIDARTKQDITQSTLLQIIAEQENTTPIFSTAILQDFIRFYHDKSQHVLSQYLESAMDFFRQQKSFLTINGRLIKNGSCPHPSSSNSMPCINRAQKRKTICHHSRPKNAPVKHAVKRKQSEVLIRAYK